MGEAHHLDELVEAARSGYKSGFEDLYRELQAPLLGFLFGLVQGEAEDLAAETWIDAAGCLSGFDGDGAEFRRLLFTIARRRAIDHGRKRSRRRTDPVDPVRFPDPDAAGDTAELVAEDEASRQAIERITRLLPRPQAEVLILRVVAGLSVAEVAEVVGRAPGAVSVLQSRALRRLATQLGGRASWDRESSWQ